jgi:hypothetical protein
MLYSEIIAVCSEIHTKHINTLCGHKVEFVNVKKNLVVHIVTTGLSKNLKPEVCVNNTQGAVSTTKESPFQTPAN